MAEDFKVNDQVITRRKIRSGTLIRFGSIIRMDAGKALVHFPIDHMSATIALKDLEKTSTKFAGATRVQPSSIQRHFIPRGSR